MLLNPGITIRLSLAGRLLALVKQEARSLRVPGGDAPWRPIGRR